MDLKAARALGESDYWTEDEAGRALALLAASGLSIREFSTRTGISRNRVQYWRSRLRGATTGPSAAEEVPAFLEVPLVRASAPAHGAWVAELSGSGPWRVSVSRDFDAAALTRLLGVLESRC